MSLPQGLSDITNADHNQTREDHCARETSEKLQIDPGTQEIMFASADCQLQGESGWVLESVDIHEEELEVRTLEIHLTMIILPEIPSLEQLEPHIQHQLHQVEGVQLKRIKPLPNLQPFESISYASVNTYAVQGILFLVLVIATFTVIYNYWYDWCIKGNERPLGEETKILVCALF